jgi:hypothetical protein
MSGLNVKSGETMEFTIAGVTNHYSLSTSVPFEIFTTDGTLLTNFINKGTIGNSVTVKNTLLAKMTTMNAVPVDNYLGAVTSWAFTINTINAIPANGKVSIIVPSQLKIDASMACSNAQGITLPISSCSYVGNEIKY